MDPIIYFLLILFIQLIITAYFRLSRAIDLSLKLSNEKPLKFKDSLSNLSFKDFSFNNFANNNAKKDIPKLKDSTQDIDKELHKCRRQLRRNLMTLNYLTVLESNPEVLQDPKPISDVINLKKRLQCEVLRNTRLVKHYSSLSA